MDHVERRRRNAHEAAHRPPAARPPLRGVPSGPPLKVYCVEPRDFWELVQRLTGAGTAAVAPAPALTLPVGAWQTAASQMNQGRMDAATLFDYSPWFSAPLLSPAYAPAGLDGHHRNGAL